MRSKYAQEEYEAFCKENGLVIHEWRTRISRVERALDDNPEERERVQEFHKEQVELRNELDARVNSGDIKLKINVGQQNKHIPGTNEYKTANKDGSKGVLTVDPSTLTKYLGRGILDTRNDGQIFETVIADEPIGIHISKMKGEEVYTKVFRTHFSKKGNHFVPIHPKKGMM